MGTRGKVILNNNGQTIHIYNHFDSYPSYLGVKLIKYFRTLMKTYGETPKEALPNIKQRIEQCLLIPERPEDYDLQSLKALLSQHYTEEELIDFYQGKTRDLIDRLHKSEKFKYANIVEMMKAGYFATTFPDNFEDISWMGPGHRLCVYEYIYFVDFDLEELVVVDINKKIKVVYPFSMLLTETNAKLLMKCVDCTVPIKLDDL